MKIKKETKKLYAVIINLGGLLHRKVVTLTRTNDTIGGFWDNTSGEGFSARCNFTLGKNSNGAGYNLYLFENKSEAEQFLRGGVAVLEFMKSSWF